ncbi:MAG: 2-keto-4-pentenoate hydratase [Hyphomicrobiaceae bacterium]
MTRFDPTKSAAFLADAHLRRIPFANLSGPHAPKTISEAYEVQEELCKIWRDVYGEVSGLKIATTTKVMQELMGIDHPCGGFIFENRIHTSPATLSSKEFIHPMLECELAVRLRRDILSEGATLTPTDVRTAVGQAMAVFEIIEDRAADYSECDARSLIADNAWNAGVVCSTPVDVGADMDLNGLVGRLQVNGERQSEGLTDDPMGALAWVANLAIERGRPLRRGMTVITGSVIATLPIKPGDYFQFTLDQIGCTKVAMELS